VERGSTQTSRRLTTFPLKVGLGVLQGAWRMFWGLCPVHTGQHHPVLRGAVLCRARDDSSPWSNCTVLKLTVLACAAAAAAVVQVTTALMLPAHPRC
jgi:hypothetical protein